MIRRTAIALVMGSVALAIALATTWTARADLAVTPALIPTFRLEGFRPGLRLKQTFTASRDGLARVDVGVAAAPEGAELDLRIVRADGQEIVAQRVRIPAGAQASGLSVRFAPQPESRGRTYALELRWPSAAPGLALEALDTDGLRDGQFVDPLRDTSATRELDMNVRLYQRRTLGEAISDVWISDPKVVAAGAGLVAVLLLATGALATLGSIWAVVASLSAAGGLGLGAVAVLRALLGFG